MDLTLGEQSKAEFDCDVSLVFAHQQWAEPRVLSMADGASDLEGLRGRTSGEQPVQDEAAEPESMQWPQMQRSRDCQVSLAPGTCLSKRFPGSQTLPRCSQVTQNRRPDLPSLTTLHSPAQQPVCMHGLWRGAEFCSIHGALGPSLSQGGHKQWSRLAP